ncbi:MAG: DUF6468 domain-containing protein [Parvularculaceae bacterium]
MNTGAILDITIIALIAFASAGGFFIHRRLLKLMRAQAEFSAALAAFDEATTRASDTLQRLEQSGLARGTELKRAAARAEALINDLSVMNSAGERVADRLEEAIRDVRSIGSKPRSGRRAA